MIKKQIISIENIDFLLFGALLVSFFLHYRINGFIAMLIIIFGVFKVVSKKQSFAKFSGLLFLPLLFILLVIGQFYTTDLKEGWTLVERNLSLILLPIACGSIVKMPIKKQNYLINIFIGFAVLIGLYCIGYATLYAFKTGSIYTHPTDTHFIYNSFMHHRLTAPVGLHAVYYSVFIAFAGSVLVARIVQPQIKKSKKIRYGFILAFIILLLYLLKSANITLGFSLVSVFIILARFGKQILHSKKMLAYFIAGTVVLSVFVFKTVQTKLEVFSFTYQMSDEGLKPLAIRLSIWECTWEVIQENWLLGTGTGDSQHELMKKYKANNFTIGIKNDFNAHNMYLQYWMSNGIIALFLFLGGILFLLKKAVQNKNVVAVSFLVLFALFSLTESTMRTQKGMLFFVFFASLFYWYPQLWQTEQSEK